MQSKKGLIQVLEGIIQEIEAETLKVNEIETINTIDLEDGNYKNKFNLFIEGYYKD